MPIILSTEFQREVWLNNNWLSLTKVRLPILEWAVPKLFIHLWVDKMALLSMMSKFHFEHYDFVVVRLCKLYFSLRFKELWLNNNWLSLTKVRLSISEWAVPKLFIHHWVDKMALLSMMSKFHFERMIPVRLGYANYIAHWVSKRGSMT